MTLKMIKNTVVWTIALGAAASAAALFSPHRALAEAPSPLQVQASQVKQLLETGKCYGCNLAGADLREAHLIGADLRNANLEGANLEGANLEGADLMGANLSRTNFTQARLTNADLRYSNMTESNLERAIAYNADARWAILTNVNLANADIYNSWINVGGDQHDREQSRTGDRLQCRRALGHPDQREPRQCGYLQQLDQRGRRYRKKIIPIRASQ